MKISELIKALEDIKEEHGDLVCESNEDDYASCGEVERVGVYVDINDDIGVEKCAWIGPVLSGPYLIDEEVPEPVELPPKEPKVIPTAIDEGNGHFACSMCGVDMEDADNCYLCTNDDCKVKWVAK